MPRYEVRFYDVVNRVKLALELEAPDRAGAEYAAKLYLHDEAATQLLTEHLVLGVVRELR